MAKQINKEEERQQQVVEAVSKTELFIENNKKYIYGIVAAILVVGAGILCYNSFYLQPKKVKAHEAMFIAEQVFAQEDYQTALEGDGNISGFLEIIDNYGSKAGSAVYFYAGVCELKLGNYEEAIFHLKKYNGKEQSLLAKSYCCIGDAYVELGNVNEAINWFVKAAETSDNIYSASYLVKAGLAAENLGENEKALSFYNKVKDEYPQSPEAVTIDKYISKIQK